MRHKRCGREGPAGRRGGAGPRVRGGDPGRAGSALAPRRLSLNATRATGFPAAVSGRFRRGSGPDRLPESNAAGSPRASMPALRGLFAPPEHAPRPRRLRAGPAVRRPTPATSSRPSATPASTLATSRWPPRPSLSPASGRRPPSGPEPARPSPAPTSIRTSSRPRRPATSDSGSRSSPRRSGGGTFAPALGDLAVVADG